MKTRFFSLSTLILGIATFASFGLCTAAEKENELKNSKVHIQDAAGLFAKEHVVHIGSLATALPEKPDKSTVEQVFEKISTGDPWRVTRVSKEGLSLFRSTSDPWNPALVSIMQKLDLSEKNKIKPGDEVSFSLTKEHGLIGEVNGTKFVAFNSEQYEIVRRELKLSSL